MAISSEDQSGVAQLQRITSEYIAAEDRIRLTGETNQGQTVALWLTQRLLGRLMPHLLGWLEQQTGGRLDAEIRQDFAQQAAIASLTPQPPVPPHAQNRSCLVQEVNINATPQNVRLTFRSAGGGDHAMPAFLVLSPLPLRQWLDVLYRLYRTAGWAADFWPDWMAQARTASVQTSPLLH
ncbi:hypothetical protein [Propionivibrio limicola]|uniref:hypothetical protein n=1 Tax=Propionivibrio limicola TaxID=167645 RepID=UPI0012928B1A|nr:hypothetical protein [Propionivibrio limicola]